jgi:hypothetical protein
VKGSNSLQLNEATIIEAVQEYLDKRYTPNVKVCSIKQAVVAGYPQHEGFTVAVAEQETSK